MSGLEIRWPDADAERIEAAKGRLDVARARLSARGADDVLEVLADVLDLWCDPASPWRLRLLDEHPPAAGFSREVVETGLDLALGRWSGAALRRALESERRALLAGTGRRLLPFESTCTVLAGAIPMPSLLQPLLPLALLSPVLVKPASRDPVTPRLLAESIAAVDPEIGRAIEVVSFASDDTASLDRFLAAECIVASGSDDTVAAIRERVRPTQRLVAYGHKLSIAVVEGGTALREADALAEALSLDVALWDQLGCLSPLAVYVAGRACEEAAAVLSEALAAHLAERARTLPRGELAASVAAAIAHERDAAAMRAAAGEAVRVYAGEGTSWTVIVEADAHFRACPLHRFVRVHPVQDAEALEAAVRPIARHLSSIALAVERGDPQQLARRTSRLGASRVCAPGRLQAPPIDWPHDGRPLLAPLARLIGDELSRGGDPAAGT